MKDILFDFDRATLRAESNSKLDQAASIIKESRTGRFLVVGHTDKKGSASYNLKLSQRRAAAVVEALEARGVNPAQLKSKGVGSAEATVPANASNAARQADRKVVVTPVDEASWSAISKRDY